MKKQVLLLSLFTLMAFAGLTSFSQIPNAGFEEWEDIGGGLVPTGWTVIFHEPAYPTVLPSTDAYSGSKSCLMQTIYNPNLGGVIGPVMSPNDYFPMSGTPQSMTGYLKGISVGGDSLVAEFQLLDEFFNTIAFGIEAISPTAGWSQFTVPLTYYTTGTVVMGQMTLSVTGDPHDGTQFYIDHLEAGGGGPSVPIMLWGATNSTGDIVSLGFDQYMADPAGNAANFTFPTPGGITVNSLNLQAGNPGVIELHVTPSFQEGQQILMNYTPGTVQSAQGIALPAYTSFPINNNVGGGGGNYSWYLVPSGTNKDLRDVRFANNTTGWAVGNEGTAVYSSNGGQSWVKQYPGSVNDLRTIWVFSPEKMMAGAWDTLFMTSNGGSSWSRIWTTSVNINVWDLFFLDQNNGFMAGEWSFYAETTDGGMNWIGGITVSSEDFRSIWFTSPNMGYTVGTAGIYAYTTNGGTMWHDSLIGTSYTSHSIFFTSAQTGWIAGEVNTLMKTSNAGLDWTQITIPGLGETDHFYCIYFINASTGWICGTGGLILKTNDGGQSWTEEVTPTGNDLYSIYFSDADHGWAVGANGTILRYGPQTSGIFDPPAREKFPLEVIPNPSTGRFRISFELEESADLSIRICDITGRIVAETSYCRYPAGVNEVEQCLENVSGGLYFLAIRDQNGEGVTRKVVIGK